jgi:integral membrane protein (TIGR00529 family)
MDPSLALFISIFFILALIRLRINVSVAIFIGALTLGLLTIGFETFERLFATITSLQTIRLLLIVLSAFTLGYSMQMLGLLERLCDAISSLIGKLSVVVLPAIIGFLPMPGGAMISAIMLTELIKRYRIKPEEATFINYWFRHLWVPIWPLYPSFIIGAAVVEVGYFEVIKSAYPVTIGMILAGIIFIKGYFAKSNSKIGYSKVFRELVASLYPIGIVVLLAIVFRIDLLLTLLTSLAVLFIHKRPSSQTLKQILRKTADPKIAILIFAVMCYKDLISYTNAAYIFFNHLKEFNFPTPIASFILAFVVGFSVGIEISYSAIALPLLTAFTGVGDSFIPKNLMLVFGAGLLGVMMSPLHLCLILTSEYYSAELSKVYRFLIPAGIVLAIAIWLAYMFI